MDLAATPVRRSDRRPWNLVATAVALLYVAAALVALLGYDALRVPHWLLVHLLMLGAVTNAIVTWSEHFTITLLRAPEPTRRASAIRLAGLNLGIVGVLVGVPTATVALTVTAAAGFILVIGWHLGSLARMGRRALTGRFSGTVRFYLVAGGWLIAGAVLGTLLAGGRLGSEHLQVRAAHVHANVFGWVGLTVLGTLFTLWPTVLRTRMADGVVTAARRSLVLLSLGLGVTVGAFVAGERLVAIAGLAAYAAGVVVALAPFARTWRQKPALNPAAALLAAGMVWLVAGVAADIALLAESDDVARYVGKLDALVPALIVGFALQTLMGALSFLVPVIRGGGPAVMKAAIGRLSLWWPVRLAALNIGVLLVGLRALAGLPRVFATVGWTLASMSVAIFLCLVLDVLVRARNRLPAYVALAGLFAICLPPAVAIAGRGRQPAAVLAGGSGADDVQIRAVDLAFSPRAVEVVAGARLRLSLTNYSGVSHDLAFPGGPATPLLESGQQAFIELPAAASDIVGWCTVPGHRAAGMTFEVRVTAAGTEPAG